MKHARVAVALILALAVVTAVPVQAANTAVGSVHTTDSDFQNAATLTNVSVVGSGESAYVEFSGGSTTTVDGFEDGDINIETTDWSGWSGDTGPLSAQTGTVLSGSYSGRIGGSDAIYRVSATSSGSTPDKISALVRAGSLSGDNRDGMEFWVYNNGNKVMRANLKYNGDIEIPAGNVIGSWSADTTYRVEFYNIDYAADTFDARVVRVSDGTVVASIAGASFETSASEIDEVIIGNNHNTVAGDPVMFFDDVRTQSGAGTSTGTYISSNHSVDRATQAWTNLTLSNASATVRWQGSNGGDWTDVSTTTYTNGGNKTVSLSGTYARYRTNVTFEPTSGTTTARLHDEGVLFSNREPLVDNSSASPSGGTTLQTGDPTLSINVSDATFSTTQGDEVNVSFYVDGSYVGQSDISSNGTVSHQVNGLTGGTHTWYATANDSYGGTTTSQTFSFNTPAQLEIRNESQPSKLVDNVTTNLVFYYKNEVQIENKSTSDGTVDFRNLPSDRSVVVVADAPGYHPRRIFIDSLIETQQVYLLPKSKESATVTFELRDYTGNYPDEPTVLKVQRAINGSWQTVEGDYFGASGSFPTTLRYNVRHRLVLLNTNTGDRRVLGSYTPVATTSEVVVVKNDGTITVQPGGPIIQVDPQVRSLRATNQTTIFAKFRNNSNTVATWNVTATFRNQTETAVLAQTNRTTQSGTYEPTLALAGRASGNVTVVVDYTLANGTTGQKRVVYQVRADYNNSNSLLAGLAGVPARFPAQHASMVTSFLAIMGSLLAATGVASIFRASSEIVGLVALTVLAGFAIIGWVGYGPVFVSSTAWVAMAAIRRGV